MIFASAKLKSIKSNAPDGAHRGAAFHILRYVLKHKAVKGSFNPLRYNGECRGIKRSATNKTIRNK